MVDRVKVKREYKEELKLNIIVYCYLQLGVGSDEAEARRSEIGPGYSKPGARTRASKSGT